MICDFDLDFLKDALAIVDQRLNLLDKKAKDSPDPDSFGVFDKLEYISGFGFVACQTYLTATYSRSDLTKKSSLDLGPKHRSGETFASLTNACANHWKHSFEWESKPLKNDAKHTIASIESLDISISDSYPIANALYELTAPKPRRFASVLPFLIQWRDSITYNKRMKPTTNTCTI